MIAGLLVSLALLFAGDPFAARAEALTRKPLAERLEARRFTIGAPIHLRIYKAESRLEVWMLKAGRYERFETYPICSWSGRLGPKLKEGDGQSPEGFYFVPWQALNPNSSYHKSFNLGYPNAFDRANGRTGSYLMVHGECVSIGCYAMTNRGIDELWALMVAAYRKGQAQVSVDILPFRPTPENLARHRDDPDAPFWRDLAEGERRFRETGKPAAIWTCNRLYSFSGGENCRPVRRGG